MPEAAPYGLLAEFKGPEELLAAARHARSSGYRALDAFTPFPVEGLAEILQLRDRSVPRLGLIGGCSGFAAALAMQLFTNFDYPINVGGRPLYALSAFAVVAFELTVLFSASFVVVGMLVMNRLPRLNHPVFAGSRFHLASRDRFFLCIKGHDPRFDESETRNFLEGLGAESVEQIPA